MGIIDYLREKKIKRETETVKDSIMANMARAGAKEETLNMIDKIKAENPQKLISAIQDVQNIMEKIKKSSGEQRTTEMGSEVQKQVQAQSGKAAELAERDVYRATAAVDTAFDEAINFGEEQLSNFGLRPGQLFGVVDRLTPSELNQYKEGFVGAGRESAALIARQIIPGVRAANITKIFARSSAELGKTMESNAQNVSASMGNAFANALSQNIRVSDESGKQVPIQSITIDKKTGRPLSQLGFKEKMRAINDFKRDFRDKLSEDYLERVFKRNPDLLQPETRKSLISGLQEFASEEEADSTLPSGKLYRIGDKIYEAT